MVNINILMLTYKSEAWLPKVLPPLIPESTDYHIKFIAVDAGIDHSAKLIYESFPDATVITSDSNNLAYLRNLALRESEKYPSDFTAFVDSDMVLPSNFYERTTNFLSLYDDNGAICVSGTLDFEGSTYTAKFWRNFRRPHNSIIKQDYVCTGSTMFKTEAVNGIIIDERCKRSDEDVDLCMQVGRRGYDIYCDWHPPYTVHIRDASAKAEFSRFIQFGKHRPITLLKYGPNSMILRTLTTDSLSYLSIISLFLLPIYGWLCFLPFLVVFGRHFLKIQKKWRIDHAVYAMLLSYTYNLLCGFGIARLSLESLGHRMWKRINPYA